MSLAFSSLGNEELERLDSRTDARAFTLSPCQAEMLSELLGRDSNGAIQDHGIEQLHIVFDEALELLPFQAAWTLVGRRHPCLSSSFELAPGAEPRQRIDARLALPVEVLDLRGVGSERRAAEIEDFLRRDRVRGFDLRQAPLHRITLIESDLGFTECVWSVHRLVADRRSFAIALSDAFVAYDAIRSGAAVEFSSSPRPFRDYVEWLRTRDRDDARSHFRQILRDKSQSAPIFQVRKVVGQAGQPRLCRTLDSDLCRRVQALAGTTSATFDEVLLAAWSVVLARFGGDEDVLFGAKRDGRSALEGQARSTVGPFANTLPVRVRLNETPTVGELIRSLRAQTLALRPFEHTALTEIRAQSELPSGGSFLETQLLFVEHDLVTDLRACSALGPRVKAITLHEEPTFAVTVEAHLGDKPRVELLFDASRVSPTVAARLLDAFIVTLDELTHGEQQPVADLWAVPAGDRERLLEVWNDTACSFSEHLLIHELFEQQCAATPDAVAVEVGARRFSYGEVEARANRMARLLRTRGAKPGSYIGIYLRRDIDLIVALLAVSKSGAAYVPLDHRYPSERIRFMLAETGALCVLTDSAAHEDLSVRTLELDSPALQSELAAQSSARLKPSAQPTDECYVIYTSGSTGKPKGVVLTHRAVVNTLDWVNKTFSVGPRDRLLFVTSPGFDLSVYDVFGVLGAGGTVVIADEALLADPAAAARALCLNNITIWNSAPAALQMLMPFTAGLDSGSSLRLVMLSGDWIPVKLIPMLRATWPDARLVSLGGATEAAIWSNYYPIDVVNPDWASIPYGRPIQNCEYYALDSKLRPVPVGCTGELYIGGVCLANGYLQRSELTAERFIPNPFSKAPGARLYRTGDLVRYLEDGNLEILGRADLQLKIRGFRVEIAEVETALTSLPSVRAAACVATRLDASMEASLIAFVVLDVEEAAAEAAIKRRLRLTLPEYMVPTRIAFVPAIPTSPNGKIDRQALLRPELQRVSADAVPLRTATERAIADIWQRLLRRSPISANDDFFALGGHSLLVVQLFDELSRSHGVELPMTTLLEYPTVAALAARLDEVQWSSGAKTATANQCLVPVQVEGSLPPLFFIPGMGASPVDMRSLSAALGANQPFFGLQYPEVPDESAHRRSIEQIAEGFLSAIRRLRPRGPYLLSGFSAGGVVAFEMARMLASAGERVPLLVLIDAFNPALPTLNYVARARLFARRCLYRPEVRTWKWLMKRLTFRFELMEARLFGTASSTRFKRQHLQSQLALGDALQRYSVHSYDGNVLLIRTSDRFAWDIGYQPHESNGWRQKLGGKLQVVPLECPHDDVLHGRVQDTAAYVRDALSSFGGGAQG